MTYRVHIKASYVELIYDFQERDSAVNFLENLVIHHNSVEEDVDRDYSVWLTIEDDF